jgi:hypothetical protein
VRQLSGAGDGGLSSNAAARYYLRLLVSQQAVLAPVLVYPSIVALNNATPADALRTELPLRAGAVTAVAPGLACGVAGTSLARARRPGQPGRPGGGRPARKPSAGPAVSRAE